MSELPKGWTEAVVSDVLESWDRLRDPLNSDERAGRKGPYPYFGANGQVDSIDDYRYDGEYVLVAEDGGYFDQPERGVAYVAGGKFWVNNHAHVLKPRGEQPVRFFLHALNAINWMPHVGGSTRLKLTAGSLERVPLALPPLNEQRRIVEKLDAVFEKSRAAKARLERLPALLDKLKRSILAAAFRGDLTKDWRAAHPDVEPASVLLERIRAERRRRWEEGLRAKGKDPATRTYQAPEKHVPSDADVPSSWTFGSLDDVTEIQAGYGFPPELQGRLDGDLPFFKVGDISRAAQAARVYLDAAEHYISRAEAEAIKADPVPAGAVVFAKIGAAIALNRRAVTTRPSLIDNNAMGVWPHAPALLLPEFVFFFMRTVRLEELAQATTVPSIRKSDVERIAVPLPPVREQAEIVARLRTALDGVDRLVTRVTNGAKRADALERAALAKAFRGELVPQDPTDEPASALLERIRAARAADPAKLRRGRAADRSPAAPAAKQAAPSAPKTTPAEAQEGEPLDLVVAAFQQAQRLTAGAIADATGLDAPAVRKALKALADAGQVRVEGKARGTAYVWKT